MCLSINGAQVESSTNGTRVRHRNCSKLEIVRLNFVQPSADLPKKTPWQGGVYTRGGLDKNKDWCTGLALHIGEHHPPCIGCKKIVKTYFRIFKVIYMGFSYFSHKLLLVDWPIKKIRVKHINFENSYESHFDFDECQNPEYLPFPLRIFIYSECSL